MPSCSGSRHAADRSRRRRNRRDTGLPGARPHHLRRLARSPAGDRPPAQVACSTSAASPVFGDTIVSNSAVHPRRLPPTARFRIASETLAARQDMLRASFGSDEVRVRVRAYPITATLTDLTLGAEQAFDSPEFGDMDSGTSVRWPPCFSRPAGADGRPRDDDHGYQVKIDSEQAYRDQINSFSDAFMHYLKLALAGIGTRYHRRRSRRRHQDPAHGRALPPDHRCDRRRRRARRDPYPGRLGARRPHHRGLARLHAERPGRTLTSAAFPMPLVTQFIGSRGSR